MSGSGQPAAMLMAPINVLIAQTHSLYKSVREDHCTSPLLQPPFITHLECVVASIPLHGPLLGIHSIPSYGAACSLGQPG